MANSTTRKPEEQDPKDEGSQVLTSAPSDLSAPSGRYVKHLPHELFSARVITEAQWEQAGVYGQPGVEWNESNDFQLPVELFNEAALNYCDNRDDGFKIVGG